MYSSTSLSGPAASGCWKQLDYQQVHMHSLLPWRAQTDVGIAAHAVMQMVAERRATSDADVRKTAEDTAHELIRNGRVYRGHQCPPLPADDVYAGVAIAVDYLTAHPLDLIDADEVRIEEEIHHPKLPYSAIVDLLIVSEEGDEETSMSVVEVTDYKTSWQAGENELNTMQRWGQAILAKALYPKADCIRVRVVNLRTWREYTRDIFVEHFEDSDDLQRWEKRIAHLCETADFWETGKRPANPGAGCLTCPYVHRCPDAWQIQGEPLDDSVLLGTMLAQTEAQRKLLIDALKASVEGVVPIAGGEVGYHAVTSRVPSPGAEMTILQDWLTATATELPEDLAPVLSSFLTGLKLGKGNFDAFAKALMPERKKGIVQLREDYVASCTDEKRSSRFGVWPK